MNDGVQILRASGDDYNEIYALQHRAYATEDALYDDTIPPMLQTLQEAVEDCRKNLVLKAVADGAIIGSVRGCQKNKVCHISKLMVDPAFRMRGIGTALLQAIENAFSPEQYRLFTGNRSKNNIALYERLGYKIFKTEPEKELVHMIKHRAP